MQSTAGKEQDSHVPGSGRGMPRPYECGDQFPCGSGMPDMSRTDTDKCEHLGWPSRPDSPRDRAPTPQCQGQVFCRGRACPARSEPARSKLNDWYGPPEYVPCASAPRPPAGLAARMAKMSCVVLILAFILTACSAEVEEGREQSRFEVGETIYRQYCFSCHSSGVNGAPRMGDVEAWALLEEKGDAELLRTTKEGILPFMPEMGLCLNCSDEELTAAIDYMMLRIEPEQSSDVG